MTGTARQAEGSARQVKGIARRTSGSAMLKPETGVRLSIIEDHYNKFTEDKRLLTRRGNVEFTVSMKYIHECLRLLENESENLGKKYLNAAQECDSNAVAEAHDDASEISCGGDAQTSGDASSIALDDDVRTRDGAASRMKIIDIGAGTGRYSIALAEEGYDVTAVELVKYNLGIMKAKIRDNKNRENLKIKAVQADALNLKKFNDDSFDMALLFGPMYHLYSFEDRLRALREARRVVKKDGFVLVAYLMNEYSLLTYAFKEDHLDECLMAGRITEDYHIISDEADIYSYVRLEDMTRLVQAAGMSRYKMISPDGPASYLRPDINSWSEDKYRRFVDYQLKNCERPELLGAGAHAVDILIK